MITKTHKKQKNNSKVLVSIILIFLIILFVLNPEKNIEASLSGILVWANALLPALFPFFVFTKMLIELEFMETITKFFAPLTQKLYKTPSISAYIFIMSIISGYPLGAIITSDLYKKGLINYGQASRITTFTSTSGPLFILGTVGIGMFGSYKLGLIVLACHIIGAILNGLIYRNSFTEKKENNNIFDIVDTKHSINTSYISTEKTNNNNNNNNNSSNNINNSNNTNNFITSNNQNNRYNKDTNNKDKDDENILEKVMLSSIKSILIIGGYVTVFFVIISMLNSNNILLPLTLSLEKLFTVLNINANISNSIINGIIEITKGCLDLSKLNLDFKTSIIVVTGIISFGGLSIHMQALTFLRKFKINIGFYFLQKTTHTFISVILAIVATRLF